MRLLWQGNREFSSGRQIRFRSVMFLKNRGSYIKHVGILSRSRVVGGSCLPKIETVFALAAAVQVTRINRRSVGHTWQPAPWPLPSSGDCHPIAPLANSEHNAAPLPPTDWNDDWRALAHCYILISFLWNRVEVQLVCSITCLSWRF